MPNRIIAITDSNQLPTLQSFFNSDVIWFNTLSLTRGGRD